MSECLTFRHDDALDMEDDLERECGDSVPSDLGGGSMADEGATCVTEVGVGGGEEVSCDAQSKELPILPVKRQKGEML